MRFKDVDFSLALGSLDALCSGGWVRAISKGLLTPTGFTSWVDDFAGSVTVGAGFGVVLAGAGSAPPFGGLTHSVKSKIYGSL